MRDRGVDPLVGTDGGERGAGAVVHGGLDEIDRSGRDCG